MGSARYTGKRRQGLMSGSVWVFKIHNGKNKFKPTNSIKEPRPTKRRRRWSIWASGGERFDENIKPVKVKKMKVVYKGSRLDSKSVLKTYSSM